MRYQTSGNSRPWEVAPDRNRASLNGARLERSASLRVVWRSILVPTLGLAALVVVGVFAAVVLP